jgi:predicted Zn-dependent protease
VVKKGKLVTLPVSVVLLALAQAQGSAHDWYTLGRSRVALAAQAYGELLNQVPPDSAYVLAISADGLMRRQQYPRAIMMFREALAKEPSLVSARSALAEMYRKLGRPGWAAKEQAAIESLDCTSHKLECEAAAGRYDAVLAATKGQRTPAALYWCGQAYTGLAYEAFARLEKLPPSPELHRYRAGLDWEAGRRLEVAQELREAVRLAPSDRELRRDLAVALGAAGFYEEAFKLAGELLRDEPDSARLNAVAGDALLSMQKAEEALPFLKKSVALDPKNLMAQSSLGHAYMQTGQARLAVPHLEAALPTDRDGSLYYLLSRAYRQTGQPELARQAIQKYRELSAKSAAQPAPEITPP